MISSREILQGTFWNCGKVNIVYNYSVLQAILAFHRNQWRGVGPEDGFDSVKAECQSLLEDDASMYI